MQIAIRFLVLFPWIATCWLAAPRAQCSPQWQAGGGLPGADGPIWAAMQWDPDGAGPATPVVVFGGSFTVAGTTLANRVVIWDPVTDVYSPLANGVNGAVRSLGTLPTGELVVGGDFSSADGVPGTVGLASWNGTAWQGLGAGLSGSVKAMTSLPNGDLVVGGEFWLYSAAAWSDVAKWDGTAWTPLGSGFNATVHALATLPNGDVVAGGSFTWVSGVTTNAIARWDGAAWSSMGSGMGSPAYARVYSLAVQPNGDVVAGGTFSMAGGTAAENIARWDGAAWSPLGAGCNWGVYSLRVLGNGRLVAGGGFTTAGGQSALNIAQWDGASWSAMPGHPLNVDAIVELASGDIVAVGHYSHPPLVTPIGRWNGSSWGAIGSGLTDVVRTVLARPDGDLVVGGDFLYYPLFGSNRIARFDGTSWWELASGMNARVVALANLANGDLVAGGEFTMAGGVAASRVARWNGAAWSPMAGGMNDRVLAFATLPNGDLVAGGDFTTAGGVPAARIARWNGSSWSPLGAGLDSTVTCLLVTPNGQLIAGGYFTSGVRSWDAVSSQWLPLGGGIQPFGNVTTLACLPDGDIVAAGGFQMAGSTAANHIARWNGSAWSPLGAGITGSPNSSLVLPNGDLLVGGYFAQAGGTVVDNVARWNGSVWSDVAGGLRQVNALQAEAVYAMTAMPNGDVVVGGTFAAASGQLAVNLARLSSPCPATVQSVGAGCTGSGGANVLVADNLPWLGGTFRATGSGLPALAFVSQVYGLATLQLPLWPLLPQALPGCDLLVTPDFWEVTVSTAPTLQTELPLPSSISLVGQVVHHQLNTFALDPALVLVEVTASNALAMTLGAF